MDSLFSREEADTSRHPAVKVSDADFADDLALINDNVAEAQEFLMRFELADSSVGLHLNEGKTKYQESTRETTIVKRSRLSMGRALTK